MNPLGFVSALIQTFIFLCEDESISERPNHMHIPNSLLSVMTNKFLVFMRDGGLSEQTSLSYSRYEALAVVLLVTKYTKHVLTTRVSSQT